MGHENQNSEKPLCAVLHTNQNIKFMKKPIKQVQKDRFFHRSHARYITATYHKLHIDVNIKDLVVANFIRINSYLETANYKIRIKYLTVTKELYTNNAGQANKDLCHLHTLIELDRPLRIHSHKKTAGIFSLKSDGNIFYPHLSPLVDQESYCRYITKKQIEDEKYTTDSWYYSYSNGVELPILVESDQLDAELNHAVQYMDIMSKNDLLKILKKYKLNVQLKHRRSIDYLFAKLPNSRERIEDYLLSPKNIKYLADHYQGNLNFNTILKEIDLLLSIPSKQSVQFIGPSNTYKTSMIWAALLEIQKKRGIKLAVTEILNYDDAKKINNLDTSQIDYLIVIFDDCDINQDWKRSDITNLLQGNERNSVITCRYENANFNHKHIKIFVHNIPFDKLLNPMLPEYYSRIKIIRLPEVK